MQSKDLVAFVESLGSRLSPNPNLLQLPLRWDQFVAVRPSQSTISSDREGLVGLLKLAYLNILVAAADGHVAEDELAFFDKARSTVSLDAMEESELSVTMSVLLHDTNLALKNLNRLAKSVPSANRHPVFLYLVRVAASDGLVTNDERKILLRIQKAFDLPESTLEETLAVDEEFQTVQVGSKKKGSSKKGEAIPAPPEPKTEPGFSLDHDRIAALSAETREVVAILGQLLAEDPAAEAESTAPDDSPSSHEMAPSWTEGLDSRNTPALLEVVSHDSLSSSELDSICQKHHLMASAFVDEVNEWSDEALGDFLLDSSSDQSLRVYQELIPTEN
jgi:tellurite resistance protein